MILEYTSRLNPQPVKWILFALSLYMSSGSEPVRENYINAYKDIAIIEMHRKGVPASIKLAQAILESSSGMSSFAKSTNNHFGIKCKKVWKGETFYHVDDDFNSKGELMKSCFRSYERVIESYVDHSNFLSSRSYYRKLFFLSRYDYKGWAYGLQSCGYATDPDYAKKLISIIEREDLSKYDYM